MSKLTDLLKTKAEIEAVLEKERIEAGKRDEEIRRQKVLAESLKQQDLMDGIYFNQINEIVEKVKSIVGDKVNDNDFMFYLMCAISMTLEPSTMGIRVPNINTFFAV